MEIEIFVTAFITLFVIIDPIGLLPIFIAITSGYEYSQRRAIALRATFIALSLLLIFGLFGDHLLSAIGIGLPAFRIAGGLLLFLTAVEMLFERRQQRRAKRKDEIEQNDPSVFPLATPLMAGPGAMAAMILLIGETNGSLDQNLLIYLALLSVLLICLLGFLVGGFVEKMLGKTGVNVITRLLGMLLAALAVQFVVDGLRGLGALP